MFGCWSYCRKFKGVGEGEHGAHPFWGGGMDCFFFKSVWEEGMYGDWSFPETSERIGQRRRREGWRVANPFHGGGKDILLTKLGA